MPRTAYRPISATELNRATLARQLLLEPADVDVVTAMERIGGLQAQEAASPFIGLWSRVAGFEAETLRRAFTDRRAVKATLMRITLHAVSAADYVPFVTALGPMHRGSDRTVRRGVARPDRIPEIAAQAAAFAAVPRRSVDLRAFVAELAGEDPLDTPLWWWVRRNLPLIHVPEEVPWSFSRRPVLVTPGAWLDNRGLDGGTAIPYDLAVEHLVRRYLAAFGPASVADVGSWSGLSIAPCVPRSSRWMRPGRWSGSPTRPVARSSTSSGLPAHPPTRPHHLGCCPCGTA